MLATFLITGCASVEIAKEMTKATQSIEKSVKRIFKSPDKKEEEQIKLIKKHEISKKDEETEKQKILIEKQILIEKNEISNEQEKVRKLVTKQKKISTINLLGKTMEELTKLIATPRLIRKDGKTITARFDSINCRLFIFMNSTLNIPRIEYYELRNVEGELIDNKKDIELCFKEIKTS